MVLTVPMRNGNSAMDDSTSQRMKSSYRTYEEWKPPNLVTYQLPENVLTVPMRNGNNF